MGDQVFSITDFRKGLDTRRASFTAPTGTLRILENAVINQGGEIEKRYAFVQVATLPAAYQFIFGQGESLHAFMIGSTPTAIDPGTSPIPIVGHALADPGEPVMIHDAEAYNDKFQVSAVGQTTGTNFVWWDGALLNDAGMSAPARGSYSRTYKTKMYRIDGPYLRFAGVNDPGVTDPDSTTNPGAGFINVAINDPDGEDLKAMEVYYNYMALLSRLQVQLWTLDPDPSNDALFQVLRIGTVAPHSVVQFGTGDVMFLSDSGIRSLKAMYVNLAAAVSDVGSALDLLVTPVIRANPTAAAQARAIVQPVQGRYWMHMDGTIYVLSFFPAGEITAWSTFDPGFIVGEFACVENRVFVRDTSNNIYLYGGPSLEQFDSCKVTVRTPHHAADKPTMRKKVQSIDVACTGAWSVSIGMMTNNLNMFELAANIVDNTFAGLGSAIPYAGFGTHFAAELVNQSPGPATLAAIHFNLQEGHTK